MPYISGGRAKLVEGLAQPGSPGELNFVITAKCIEYIHQKGLSYQTINDIIGVLECAKLEFSRRVVSGYEDTKIEENGDVYPEVD